MEIRESNKNQVFIGLDIFKLFFAICVVAIHTHPLYYCEQILSIKIYNSILELAVPTFFLISGYLLFRNIQYSEIYSRKTLLKVKKYVLKILRLYLVWNAIYFPISVFGFINENTPFTKAVVLYLRGLLIVGEQYFSWPLWYLLALIYSLVIISFFLRRQVKLNWLLMFGWGMYFLSELLTQIINHKETYTGIVKVGVDILSQTIVSGRVFSGVLFVVIGIYIATTIKNERLPFWMIVAILIYIFSPKEISLFLKPFAATGILIFAKNLSIKNMKLSWCRKASTILYFSHMLFYFIWSIILKGDRWGIAPFCFTLGSGIVTIIIVLNVGKKVKVFNNIF